MKFIVKYDKTYPGRGVCPEMRETMKDMKPNGYFDVIINKTRSKSTIHSALYFVKKEFPTRCFVSQKVKTDTGTDAIRIWEIEKPKTIIKNPHEK